MLYHLHGTGQSYRTTGVGLGPAGQADSAYVRALTSGPPGGDPAELDAPWEYADPSTWVDRPPLDLIIVAPHGLTLPGGFGPAPDKNPFWFDWNPRYAAGGDTPRYDTPPPRFETFLVDQLLPFVDAHFPTGHTRQWRAVTGYSMGGIGALPLGLKHPDLFASVGMISGGILPVPATDEQEPRLPVGAGGIDGVDHQQLPGVVPAVAPEAAFDQLYGPVATVGWGDPVADDTWWRYNLGGDLVPNARAYAADGTQALHLKYHVNDAVPRVPEAATADPERFAMQQFFETALLPTNLDLETLMERFGIERDFELHPGNHDSHYYQHPWLRSILEDVVATLAGPGTVHPVPDPVTFSYRSVLPSFRIWGWRVAVERDAMEFLDLRDVSCDGFEVQGTGVVTVTVPATCGTGRDGSRVVSVDLGPSHATDEVIGVGTLGAYGTTRVVELEALP